eukprot:4253043-Alexandrium_andersonii.AAC.1
MLLPMLPVQARGRGELRDDCADVLGLLLSHRQRLRLCSKTAAAHARAPVGRPADRRHIVHGTLLEAGAREQTQVAALAAPTRPTGPGSVRKRGHVPLVHRPEVQREVLAVDLRPTHELVHLLDGLAVAV